MPRPKIPLKQLVEDNKKRRGILFGWREFTAIASQQKRPSYQGFADVFGPTAVTMKTWLKRYDEGEKK